MIGRTNTGGGENVTEEVRTQTPIIAEILAELEVRGAYSKEAVNIWYKYDKEGGEFIEAVVSNMADMYPVNGEHTDGFFYVKIDPHGDKGELIYLKLGEDEALLTLESAEFVDLDATANDVRLGKKVAVNSGVIEGTKDIPTYHTNVGAEIILENQPFKIVLDNDDSYDYTEFQAMTMPLADNEDLDLSVAVDRAVIKDSVYAVNSTTAISTVTKDDTNKSVSLGITNGSTKSVIRYFTYKEVY